MKQLIAILPLLYILSSEASSAGAVYEAGSSISPYACEFSKSFSTDDSTIRVRPFPLDIIPPSSGVQFYRNGIIFLSYSKVDEKVPEKHLSFGSLKTFMTIITDTVPGNHMPFLLTSSGVFPSEATTFSEDYNTMYLSLIPDKDSKEKIFKAAYSSTGWVIEDKPLSFCSDNFIYSHPSLSYDGTFIVFSSDMIASSGGLDLFITKKEGEKWSNPENLGKQINSSGNELFASLDSRNNLYFSSDGIPGEGGYDIYVCRFNGTGWDKPHNLSTTINSKDDEVAFTISRTDKKSAFYTSRSKSGKYKTQLNSVMSGPLTGSNANKDLSHQLLAMSGIADQNSPEKTVSSVQAAMAPAAEVKTKAPATEQKAPSKTAEPEKKIAETKETPPPSAKPVAAASTQDNKDVVKYRVQILANTKPVGSYNITVAGKTYKSYEYLYKGGYRTTIGEFRTMAEAAKLQSTCRQNGYSQAFVVAFKNDIRTTDPELFK